MEGNPNATGAEWVRDRFLDVAPDASRAAELLYPRGVLYPRATSRPTFRGWIRERLRIFRWILSLLRR